MAREGTKKTVFTNFMELCKAMNRQLEHVQLFLLAELGTSGNLDGQNRLIVKGRFLPKAFEGVLRRYVNECAPAPAVLCRCACVTVAGYSHANPSSDVCPVPALNVRPLLQFCIPFTSPEKQPHKHWIHQGVH